MGQIIDPALAGNAAMPEDATGVAHPLDHPVWAALTTQHRGIAEGDSVVRRYPSQIAPFAATVDNSPASFQALETLIANESHPVALVMVDDVNLPDAFEIVFARTINQMLGTSIEGPYKRADIVPLGAKDAPEMMALVELTKPGPFSVRTHELGTYLGVRDGSRLVAMAGERMRLDGFTEISAVCTHPDHRGRGYARALITALVQAVSARGELPFLHVVSENQSAIALYHELGFTLRQTMHFTVLRCSQ
jgi:ribosomal protein S18 acetylase RimI-like enzyme